MRKKIILLEDDADVAAKREFVELRIVHLTAGDFNRASLDRAQAVDAPD